MKDFLLLEASQKLGGRISNTNFFGNFKTNTVYLLRVFLLKSFYIKPHIFSFSLSVAYYCNYNLFHTCTIQDYFYKLNKLFWFQPVRNKLFLLCQQTQQFFVKILSCCFYRYAQGAQLKRAQTGFMGWIKATILFSFSHRSAVLKSLTIIKSLKIHLSLATPKDGEKIFVFFCTEYKESTSRKRVLLLVLFNTHKMIESIK